MGRVLCLFVSADPQVPRWRAGGGGGSVRMNKLKQDSRVHFGAIAPVELAVEGLNWASKVGPRILHPLRKPQIGIPSVRFPLEISNRLYEGSRGLMPVNDELLSELLFFFPEPGPLVCHDVHRGDTRCLELWPGVDFGYIMSTTPLSLCSFPSVSIIALTNCHLTGAAEG
jgi:hypothetical protein